MLENVIKTIAIDDAIYNSSIFELNSQDFSELSSKLISNYLSETYSKCIEYSSYVDRTEHRENYHGVPYSYIPTSIFKTRSLLMSHDFEVDKWCFSSGTTQIKSKIGRGRTSLERLLGSVKLGLAMFEEWDEEEVTVLHLGPSYEEAGDIWFPYVMSMAELLYDSMSFGVANTLNYDSAVENFIELRSQGRKIGLIGPPFAIKAFSELYTTLKHPKSNDENVAVLTGGGWKTHTGAEIPRKEFKELITRALGLSDTSRVRDAFNQVELNTVLVECDHHRFHVPPWVDVSARSMQTLEKLEAGQEGLLAYIDASAASYPCIFIGDDIGSVENSGCKCGRSGKILNFSRRLDRGGAAGCSVALSEKFSHS